MSDYNELALRLKEFSYNRKGEIAKLTYDASVAIGVLEGRVKVLEKQLSEKDGKQRYEDKCSDARDEK